MYKRFDPQGEVEVGARVNFRCPSADVEYMLNLPFISSTKPLHDTRCVLFFGHTGSLTNVQKVIYLFALKCRANFFYFGLHLVSPEGLAF